MSSELLPDRNWVLGETDFQPSPPPNPRRPASGVPGVPPDQVYGQKSSRRLELSISKDIPHGRCRQGPGSVDPRFPAGLPFPVPEIIEFVAFRDSGKFFQQFSRDFPGVFLENPQQIPETATAFSSFLIWGGVQRSGHEGWVRLEWLCSSLESFYLTPYDTNDYENNSLRVMLS